MRRLIASRNLVIEFDAPCRIHMETGFTDGYGLLSMSELQELLA